MKCVTIGLDLGNETVKLVDDVGQQVLPNVICRSSLLKVYDDRVDPVDFVNFSLISEAAEGSYFLGNLAARQDTSRTLFMPAQRTRPRRTSITWPPSAPWGTGP